MPGSPAGFSPEAEQSRASAVWAQLWGWAGLVQRGRGNTRGEGMGGRPLGSGRFPERWQNLARRGAVSKAFLLGPGKWLRDVHQGMCPEAQDSLTGGESFQEVLRRCSEFSPFQQVDGFP